MEVRFHRLAQREYQGARAWYEARRAGLGRDFTAAVDRAVGSIAAHPDRWSLYRDRFRWVRVRRFPYRLYYAIAGPDLVHVLAVAHVRRRAGYWIRRAPRA
jgi:hypothetical protein